MIKKVIINNIGIVLAVLAILTVTVYAWTGPTDAPPRDNVPAPINVGDPANPNNYNQRKDGKLSIKAPIPANYDFRVGGAIKVDDAANGVSVFDRSLAIFGSAAVIGNLQVRDGLTATEAGGWGDIVEVGKDSGSPGIRMMDSDGVENGGPYIDMVNTPGYRWNVRLWNDWLSGNKNIFAILGWDDSGRGDELNYNYKDIKVGIGTLNPTETLTVDGNGLVLGDMVVRGTKKFIQDHPTDPTKQIAYVSLEGGEAGTYVRGEGKLMNGKAVINLPDHFSLVTESVGLTAQVTPVDEMNGIKVTQLTNSKMLVEELKNGRSSGKFYYLVNGVRKGYSNYQPIQDKH